MSSDLPGPTDAEGLLLRELRRLLVHLPVHLLSYEDGLTEPVWVRVRKTTPPAAAALRQFVDGMLESIISFCCSGLREIQCGKTKVN